MTITDETTDISADTEPRVQEFFDGFVEAGGQTPISAGRLRADDIRYCRWDGRTSDGRKHRKALNKEPVPWENASDARIPLADDTINELGDMLCAAFRRARVHLKPTEAGDLIKAQTMERVLEKYLDRIRSDLNTEAELAWNYVGSYGVALWQVTWERQMSMKMQPIQMTQLFAAAVAARRTLEAAARANADAGWLVSELDAFPETIQDADREEEAVRIAQDVASHLARQLFPNPSPGQDWMSDYKLSATAARQAVRDLREYGEAEFPMPYLSKNGPAVVARQVGYDVFLPSDCTLDIQRSRWIQVRDWLTEAELDENAITDGWDADWIAAAKATKGKYSTWEAIMGTDVEWQEDEAFMFEEYTPTDTKNGLVEVIYAYSKRITPEGVPQIWCTVYCPHALQDASGDEIYAAHYPLEYKHGRYPFVATRRENVARRFLSVRGIPEITSTWQDEVKRAVDMLNDRMELEINPPMQVVTRLAMKYRGGPGSQYPRQMQGDLEPMPPPPGNPKLALEQIQQVNERVAKYFGLINVNTPPALWQMRQQALAERWLSGCAEVLRQITALIQQFADAAELARIAGGQVDWPRSPEEIQGSYDVDLQFTVADLDMEFVFKKLQAIISMAVPIDRAGVIDLGQLVKVIMLAIDSTLAPTLMADKAGAAQKVFTQVQQDFALMALGNEVQYVENDPTAGMKLEFARRIVGTNPKYQLALTPPSGAEKPMPPDPIFAQRVEKYTKNLMQSLAQDQNKAIGRLGVEPNPAQPS